MYKAGMEKYLASSVADGLPMRDHHTEASSYDCLCRHPGQEHADACGEVWLRRPLPVDVRADDGAEDDPLKQVHGRSLSFVQPKPLKQQKQNEEDRDWQQNPDYLHHIPPP